MFPSSLAFPSSLVFPGSWCSQAPGVPKLFGVPRLLVFPSSLAFPGSWHSQALGVPSEALAIHCQGGVCACVCVWPCEDLSTHLLLLLAISNPLAQFGCEGVVRVWL